jgi:Flp pilus assembly protein TadG
MRRWLRPLGSRGAAAVELAVAFPVVLVLLGNIVDYGVMIRRHAQLAAGVANAGAYASRTGSGVALATLQTITTSTSGLSGATASATAAACYCPTGTPRALGTAVACTATCADGSTASKYLTVSGRYAYSPYFPHVMGPTARTLTHSATVMVQ